MQHSQYVLDISVFDSFPAPYVYQSGAPVFKQPEYRLVSCSTFPTEYNWLVGYYYIIAYV